MSACHKLEWPEQEGSLEEVSSLLWRYGRINPGCGWYLLVEVQVKGMAEGKSTCIFVIWLTCCWIICPVVTVADSFPEIRTNISKFLSLIRDQGLYRNLPYYQCLEKMPLRFSIALFFLILPTMLIWIWQLYQNISITWVFVLLLTACRSSKIQQSLYFLIVYLIASLKMSTFLLIFVFFMMSYISIQKISLIINKKHVVFTIGKKT